MTSDSNSIRKRNSSLRNTYRLSIKELKEILRDRRTIITLVAMPLLIYPLLSILFQKFYLSANVAEKQVAYKYVLEQVVLDANGDPIESASAPFISPKELKDLFIIQYINPGEAFVFSELEFPSNEINGVPVEKILKPLDEDSLDPQFVREFELRYFEQNVIEFRTAEDKSLEEMVKAGQADVGIRIFRAPEKPLDIQIIQLKSGVSANAANYLRKRIDKSNLVLDRIHIDTTNRVLSRMVGSKAQIWQGATYSNVSFDGEKSDARIPMSRLVPLILILMTVTGAVYPAIDLTAGERERGTLEALIAAPVPRFQVLFAKFVGVLTVAMLTAVVNMVGMFTTLAVFGLLPLLFGEEAFGWLPIIQVFGLLILFAGFFSAVLLAVTSFARSFKEAQAYIVPVTLLSITPGIISLTPNLELTGFLTVIPLINIVLLAREIMEGTATALPAVVAIASTTFYGIAALSVAANIFGSDSILYGSQSSWRSMIRRPSKSTTQISVSRSLACLAVLFPLSFISLALVGRVPQWVAEQGGIAVEEVPYWVQLVPFVVSTALVFVVVPSFFLWHGKIRMAAALRFVVGNPMAYIAALLFGLCMWPLTGQLVESLNQLYAFMQGYSDEPEWKTQLLAKAKEIVEKWRTVSPVIIVSCFSIVPAICEEFYFRGVLLRSIAARNKEWVAVVLSALIFGVFHTLSLTDLSSQKFIPSFLAGLVLAWIALRSGSIIPGIVMHSLNNGFLVSMAYYEDRLVANGWIEKEQSGFPIWILALAGIGFTLGCLILSLLVHTRRPHDVQQRVEA